MVRSFSTLPLRVVRTLPWLVALALLAGCGFTRAPLPPPGPAGQGSWSAVLPLPRLAVHASLLPNGQVLFFDGPAPEMYLWDPDSGAVERIVDPDFNAYCVGHALLADGRVFLAGGHIMTSVGLPAAATFDPLSRTWRRLPDMRAGRWYPTTTVLASGDVLVLSGDVGPGVRNPLPEIWQEASQSWRALEGAQRTLQNYPYAYLAPDGRVFVAGPEPDSQYLDTTRDGNWSPVATSQGGWRNSGSSVMYDEGKVLIMGGGNPATATAEVIDLNETAPTWRTVSSMASPRRRLNATLLPDGTVLAVGGSSGDNTDESAHPVLAAELWDPTSDTWTTLASHTVYRGYHSISLLLPDARVLVAGGQDGGPSAEVFSPPYLFRGPRPAIQAAPEAIGYGATFVVETPDAAAIARVTWLRLGSATHGFDQNQRFNHLSFTAEAGRLLVAAPAHPNLSPPGHYLLFLLNGDGVPSIGRVIQIGPAADSARS